MRVADLPGIPGGPEDWCEVVVEEVRPANLAVVSVLGADGKPQVRVVVDQSDLARSS